MNFLTKLLIALGLKKHKWFEGPGELKEVTKTAINTAIAELQKRHNIKTKFDWKKDVLVIRVSETKGNDRRGVPFIDSDNDGSLEYGSYQPNGKIIYLPKGCTFNTLAHEVGHYLLHHEGVQPDTHHKMYRSFFDTFTGRQGGARIW